MRNILWLPCVFVTNRCAFLRCMFYLCSAVCNMFLLVGSCVSYDGTDGLHGVSFFGIDEAEKVDGVVDLEVDTL